MQLGPTELILILVIVAIFFGVGRLPEVFGSLGKGVREFRKAVQAGEEDEEHRSSGREVPDSPRIDEENSHNSR